MKYLFFTLSLLISSLSHAFSTQHCTGFDAAIGESNEVVQFIIQESKFNDEFLQVGSTEQYNIMGDTKCSNGEQPVLNYENLQDSGSVEKTIYYRTLTVKCDDEQMPSHEYVVTCLIQQ